VSHPANVLVMAPGGYKFSDFARVGSPLTAIIFVLILILIPIFWPF
jgi:di/tricarboxylate transporter